jgi:uncharacterized lipoprotein YajG
MNIKRTLTTAGIAGTLLLTGCGDSEPSETATPTIPQEPVATIPEETTVTTPPRDRSSSLACDHFRNVLGDADILTSQELRVKLQEVESNANIATPAVQRSARDLLVAATAGDAEGVTRAVVELSDACSAAGF